MKKSSLAISCTEALSILNQYYAFENQSFSDCFLMPPKDNSLQDGQVLIQEEADTIFLGVQFSEKILKAQEKESLSPHEVCVLAEEMSHFQVLSECVAQDKKISVLELETLGEIDRFLCVMHWNALSFASPKLSYQWKNLHEVCDVVFTGERFREGNRELYIQAENKAFQCLKQAFADKWDCTHYNFERIHTGAQITLKSLRKQFLA
jgi:hypothetical protein